MDATAAGAASSLSSAGSCSAPISGLNAKGGRFKEERKMHFNSLKPQMPL